MVSTRRRQSVSKKPPQKVTGTQVLVSGKLGTGQDTNVQKKYIQVYHKYAEKQWRNSLTMEKFLDEFEGTEEDMKSMLLVWDTTRI